MYVIKQVGVDWHGSAPLENIHVMAATELEARKELKQAVAIHRFLLWHDREVRRATKIYYDPVQRCYVADCGEMGVVGTGMTRADARDKVYAALRQIALTQLESVETPAEEMDGQD